MQQEIDKADRRILYELDRNSRLSFAQIGKRIHIAPETVRYRVGRLVEKGVVRRFSTLVNLSRLDFTIYKVFLKLQIVDDKTVKDIVDFLCGEPEVMWVARIEGAYDLGVMIRVRRVTELEEFINALSGRFSNSIARRVFSVNIRGQYFPRAHLAGKKRPQESPRQWYSALNEPCELDATNFEILRQLALDSRTSAVTLAEFLERSDRIPAITPEAVLQRIKRLETDRVITGYNVLLDHTKIREYRIKVLLYVTQINSETAAAFAAYCGSQSNIVYLVKALGEWDYELDFQVEEIGQYIETLMEIFRLFPGVVRDHVALMILDHYKYNFFP